MTIYVSYEKYEKHFVEDINTANAGKDHPYYAGSAVEAFEYFEDQIGNTYTASEIDYYADRSSKRLAGLRRTLHVRDLIAKEGPFRFFVTVSSCVGLSQTKSMEYGKAFTQRFTKKIVGKRWKKQCLQPLTGIVIFERADVIRNAKHKHAGWHCHILVHDHPALPDGDAEALKIVTDAYWSAVSRLTITRYRRGRKPSLVQLITKTGNAEEDQKRVQLVDDLEGLCKYLSKEVWKEDWEWLDRFFYLGSEGIQSTPEGKPFVREIRTL
jgi:hypothetical protein